MRSPKPDADMLIEALRSDLPSAAEKEQTRARLAAAGIIATTSLVAPSTAGASTLTAAGVKTSLLPKLGTLPWFSKVGLATTVVTVGAAVPVASYWALSGQAATPAVSVASPAGVAKQRAESRPQASLQKQGDPAKSAAEATDHEDLQATAAPQRAATERRAAAALGAESSERPPPTQAPNAPASSVSTPAIEQPLRQTSRSAEIARGSSHRKRGTPSLDSDEEQSVRRASATSSAGFPRAEMQADDLTQQSRLQEETELIERAMSALRRGDRAAAASFLAEHRRRFPEGALAPERERTERRIDEF